MSQFSLPQIDHGHNTGRHTEPLRKLSTPQRPGTPRSASFRKQVAVAPPSARKGPPAPRFHRDSNLHGHEELHGNDVLQDPHAVVDRAAYHAEDGVKFQEDKVLEDIATLLDESHVHIVTLGGDGIPPHVVTSPNSPSTHHRKLTVPLAGDEAVLICCQVNDLNVSVVPQLLARLRKSVGCPPIVALILRPKLVSFDTHLIAAASTKLAQLKVDSVIVQPRDKLDLPDMLQAACAMARQQWEAERLVSQQIDDRANGLLFNHIEQIIPGFPKLNTQMQERPRTKSSKGGIGRHNFVHILGEGKFGVVYKTEAYPGSETPDGEAVKMIPKRCIKSAKHANQVLTECRLMQKAKHPNIAEFRGLVHGKCNLYIFMEFVGSSDLSSIIRGAPCGRLTSNMALEYFLQILDAIVLCHSLLVAHRDLKSENIVVTEYGVPKLVDFGLGTQLYDPPRLCDDRCGTIPFAPPEVYRGQQYEASAMDIWSLGILVLEMRCGNDSVCKLLRLEKAQPNQELASTVEAFFENPDWPSTVQQTFPGVGMAEELLFVLRSCLLIQPSLRWPAIKLYEHIASSSRSERITDRASDVEYCDRFTDCRVTGGAMSFSVEGDEDFRKTIEDRLMQDPGFWQ